MKSDKGLGPFFVYKIVNTVNGKAYVGITSVSPESRLNDHVKRAIEYKNRQVFAAAICKYGAQAFEIETLEIVDSWEDAQQAEIRYIAELNTHISTGNGYNMTLGGDGSYGRVITAARPDRVRIDSSITEYKNSQQSRTSSEVATALFRTINSETADNTFSLRLTPTERQYLAKLAKAYSMPMGEVLQRMLHQAIVDYEEGGEVIALSKY